MLDFMAVTDGPMAVRYPRGSAFDGLNDFHEAIVLGKSETIFSGSRIAILAVGNMVAHCLELVEELKKENMIPTFVNVRFVKPFDQERVLELAKTHDMIVTVEENVITGGFGQSVLSYLNTMGQSVKVLNFALPDQFLPHGSPAQLRKDVGLDVESMKEKIMKEL